MYRGFIVGALAVAASMVTGGCDEESASTLRLTIDAPFPGGEVCVAVATLDAAGETVASRGDRTAASREAALASGAVCMKEEAAVSTLRCAPGASTALTWVVGIFDAADGSAVPTDDYQDPCGAEGCTFDFECIAGQEVDGVVDLSIMREAHQGFFDIGFSAPDPGVGGLCAAVRVVNAEGLLVWAMQEICVDEYGDGRGTLTYIGTCDAEAVEHTITVVVQPPANAVGWTNPCPGDVTAVDPMSWTGGCSQAATCVENADVIVNIDRDDEP